MRIAMTLLALAVSMSACKKKQPKPTGDMGSGSAMTDTGSGSGMAGSDTGSAGSGSAMAGSDTGSGSAAGSGDTPAMSNKAGNCPSTVLGSTTKAEAKGKDIVITITSADKDAVAAIQKRASELLAEKKDAPSGTGGGHDQKGTHGGASGLCPVYLPEGAVAKAKNEKTGVAITITPKDKPEDLKKEVDARIVKADDWVKANVKPGDKGNQGGVGGGKGEHGANHSGEGDSKGVVRGKGDGKGSGDGTGGGGGKGTGGGSGKGGGSGLGNAK